MRERAVIASLLNFAVTRVNREMAGGTLEPGVWGTRISKPTGERMAAIVCDKYLVEAAIVNLLRNAVKYSVEVVGPPRVDIAVARHVRVGHAYVDISVSNMSRFIPPEYREVLLDPFTRYIDDPETAQKRGMGLGLHLVSEIAKAHGGGVSVNQSRDIGGRATAYRTTFTIRLAGDLSLGSYSASTRSEL